MANAHQFERASCGSDAMLVGRGGVMGEVVETVACRSVEKLYDVPVFDVHRPAPGHRKPPGLCPRHGEGTTERAPLAATVD